MSQRNPTLRTLDQTSLSSWFYNLPIITRTWLLGSFTVTLLVGLGLLRLESVVLLWPRVWKGLELWRLCFSIFYLGGLGMGFLFQLLFILQYSKSVEEDVFFHDPADYLFMLLFCTAVLWLWDIFVFRLFFLGPSLLSCVVYMWSKYHTHQLVSIWGLVQVPGKYIPFVYLLMDLLTSGSLNIRAVAGIVAGHCWYFVDKIYPTLPGNQGHKLITTPLFLRNWLPRRRTTLSGPIPPPTRQPQQQHDHRWGPGRVLGE
ncbi:hypothetical protein GpartN1_g4216.t1 [Galdieria partita]|uniref:Derlin n=1 Tax=Galdieria partita TaxID=83374 RepID=A0A9C7PXV0_9RHOD|nr:hypothetical protein GpartN1_g4216.t1 [Galdieria partita]